MQNFKSEKFLLPEHTGVSYTITLLIKCQGKKDKLKQMQEYGDTKILFLNH